MSTDQSAHIQAFITKWELSGAAERANAQSFLYELCKLLDVETPHAKTPDESENAYVFEKTIPGGADNSNFIDLYKRGHFILETKQGANPVGVDHDPPVSAEGAKRLQARKTGHGTRGTRGWDVAMEKARNQAENYARRLPKNELTDGLRPPFLITVDVGHSIALYTDWTRAGGHYAPFPDPASYRIPLKDLLRTEIRERLQTVWTDPLTLDPSRRSAKVTREIADRLAKLARALEGKHKPEEVSSFLMRCLFTMFSEDVDLLPLGSFTQLLGDLKKDPSSFVPALESLWASMNTGGFSPILRETILRFNGGLFANPQALPLTADHIQLLIEASTANWKDVEPAIFGTLLERALDPRERHKLGAHYTPRAYVERLVNPTVIEPLRAQWQSVQVAALHHSENGDDKKAIKEVEAFLHHLATLRILDPACGSGNFLYVTLELLKRLEGEVLNTLHDLGAQSKLELEGVMVTPANFLGIEVNPRAADIAEQVLWIGFLQWHLRTHGNLRTLQEPIIKDLHNIEKRDAVLAWDSITPLLDAEGKPVTRWDGRTTKPHPVTGEEVPDADARVPQYQYHNPRPAVWPKADYIVGNPPYLGARTIREALGTGYLSALRSAYPSVPDNCDFVMYWWKLAADKLTTEKLKRFGMITTKSISQPFARVLVEKYLGNDRKSLGYVFAVPNHPWIDSADGADVRVSIIACALGISSGQVSSVISEKLIENGEVAVELANEYGPIHSDLQIGQSTAKAVPLQANEGLSSVGYQLTGKGFVITEDEIKLYETEAQKKLIHPLVSGRDLNQNNRGLYALDLYGLSLDEVRSSYPKVYQKVLDYVKPERDQNNRNAIRTNWWTYGESRSTFRPALLGIARAISTSLTAKHRFFSFIESDTVSDSSTVIFAFDDAFILGILSSSAHVCWAHSAGGKLGVGNDPRYLKGQCFDTFPFPAATEPQQEKIRALGEQLDAHRKRQQAQHPELTMTGMYNVLERVRAIEQGIGETPGQARSDGRSGARSDAERLNAKEKTIYEQGLVGILRQLHDELDAAVAEAYGWGDLFTNSHSGRGSARPGVSPMPADHSPEPESRKSNTDEILTRLVALNAERATEEANGHVRWLRPEYQAPNEQPTAKQTKLLEDEEEATAAPAELLPWPTQLPQQAAAVRDVLTALNGKADVDAVAAHFAGKKSAKRVKEIGGLLETLKMLGVG